MKTTELHRLCGRLLGCFFSHQITHVSQHNVYRWVRDGGHSSADGTLLSSSAVPEGFHTAVTDAVRAG